MSIPHPTRPTTGPARPNRSGARRRSPGILAADWTLGATIALGFAAVLTLLGLLVGLTIVEVNRSQHLRRVLTDQIDPAISAVDDLQVSLFRVNEALRDQMLQLSGDANAIYQNASRDLSRDMSRVREREHLPEADASVARLQRAVEAFQRIADQQVRPSSLPFPARQEIYRTQVLGGLGEAYRAAEAVREFAVSRRDQIREQMRTSGDALTWYLLLGFGVGGLSCILLARHTVHLITVPLRRLMTAARALEGGDYDRAVALGEMPGAETAGMEPANELVRLGQSFARAASALREREARITQESQRSERLEEVMNTIRDAVITADAQGRCLSVNTSGAGMLGYRGDELVGRPLAELVGDTEALRTLLRTILAGGDVAHASIPLRRADGQLLPASWNASPLRNEKGEVRGMLAVARDMSPVRELQDRLVRAERLASVGLLGAGVAHELRNPLGIVSNAVFFLRRRADPNDAKVQRHFDLIEREIRRSAQVIDTLVQFSHDPEPQGATVALAPVVRQSLDRVAFPPGIQREVDLPNDLPPVVADEAQLTQVFENLTRNAVQAMGDHGCLRLRAFAADGRVQALVEDNGPGIPDADRARVFEPLFTTKAKGMGLGLALCKRIVETYGGEIRIDSVPGEGTTVRVILPAAPSASPLPTGTPVQAGGRPSGARDGLRETGDRSV
jgi:PAS domain S-box-containing protein